MSAHIVSALLHIVEAAIGYVVAYVAMSLWSDRALRSVRRHIASVLLACSAPPQRRQQAVRTRASGGSHE